MPIRISDLFKIPVIYSMDLALNGKTVLYSSNLTDLPHLYTLNTKPGSKPKQVTKGNNPVLTGLLSPNGEHIIYPQDKDGNELHHMFLTSRKDEKTRQISKDAYRTFGGGWHPKGKEFARSYATKESCGLEIFNTKTGESYVLKEQKAPFIDVRYSHDGTWIACTEYGGGKDPKNMQIAVINRNDPADTLNYKFKDGSKEVLPSWALDDKKLAFLSDMNGRNQVVIQDFQGKEHQFLDLEEGEEAIDTQEVGWAPKGDKVYYIVSKHSRTNVYEHPLEGEKTRIPFPEGTILMSKISRDGKTAVAVHSSMASPHCIYLHKIESDTVKPLTSKKQGIKLTKLSQPKSVWYKSFDGLRIHGWYLQAVRGKLPYPAIVWPHGGPWWQTFDTWSPYLQSISQSGFAVFAPNVRGSTGYGVDFRNMDVSDLGGGDLEDVVYAANWLRKQREIDSSKIALMGGSYGGFMTLMALTRKPEVFAAGVAVIPVTDWLEMYKLSDAAFRRFIEELFEGSPKEREKLYRDSSPVTYISKIKAPVLIIAGRQDSRCPIQPIEKFVKKLEKMGHPHEFKVQEKEGHGSLRVEASIREATTSIEYLRKTLCAHQKTSLTTREG